MRYFIEFSYFGKNYFGWQRQPGAISVQETLEHCISTLLKTEIPITGAGRTDTGVHARQIFAHFDVEMPLSTQSFVQRLNAFLPSDIAVHSVFEVSAGAHARFDASARTYEYWVVQDKNPFLTDFAYHFRRELDIEAMNEAAKVLLDFDDFQCFSKSGTDVKTFKCKLFFAEWKAQSGKLVFTITADRFLRNMVRAIVGTLLDVGIGKISKEDVKNIILSKNRSEAGHSVPAHGLYLTRVEYPPQIFKNHE